MFDSISKKLPPDLRAALDFRIEDDFIEWGGRQIYFLRVRPKNMSILSYSEKLTEIKKLQHFLDASATEFSLFVTDKTENLEDISNFYKRQLKLRPEYAFIIEAVLKKISTVEQSSASIQRAFYIVFNAKDRRDFEIFEKQLSGRADFYLTEKEELIQIMRNFILREYTPFDLYIFEDAVKRSYCERKEKRIRGKRVDSDPHRDKKEDNIAAIEKIANQAEGGTGNAKIHEKSSEFSGSSLWPHS